MSDTLVGVDTSALLADVHAAVDGLLDVDNTALATEDGLLELLRETERLRNRLAALDHAVILEVETRGVPQAHAACSTSNFLTQLLRLHPLEASARVRAAGAMGSRRALSGEPLEPLFPLVAEGQAAGGVSPRQAAIIVNTITHLAPENVEEGPGVEKAMVALCATFTPHLLTKVSQRYLQHLGGDGKEPRDLEKQQRERDLQFRVRDDGSSTGRFTFPAELTEHAQVIFDSLAAPRPETNGVKDSRSPGQRRCDALLDAFKLLERADVLPTSAGVSATIILTMDADDFATGSGTARTGHGTHIPTGEAIRWAAGDARLINAVIDTTKGVTHYSSSHRIFTENQRLAMIARDRGCSFVGCDIPPQWCEAHHVIPWHDTKHTSIDNGTLLCGHHHRNFERLGWSVQMINGRPHWLAPPWLDPDQIPKINHMHV